MVADSTSLERGVPSQEVTAAVDEVDGRPHLVIADLTRDDAWLATAKSDAVSVDDWR
ncbi:DUF7556 family protein [Natrialba swarupiae]|uniref:DUF7556 family protein n=1 Tax=Natrialba swarupiae TaxID=2448032 RepID=UPI00192E4D72|nr:hypothetical protein [Natrialba swarupiae]